MAKGLDDLIRHLVDEVALCGVEGATICDFVKYLHAYYEEQSPSDSATCTIDRPFQEKIWGWLIRHRDIGVGKNKEGNKLSLSEAQSLDLAQSNPKKSRQTNGNRSVTAQDVATISPHERETPLHSADDGLPVSAKNRWKGSSEKHNSEHKSKTSGGLRLYGSEDRMWQVAAGHGPDPVKVSTTEFACLSIIAARGSKGILQPELVEISGQDKRSLPRRTDQLHRNGYIEKRPVLVHGNRTSLCTLKRFVTTTAIVDRTSFSATDTASSQIQKGNVLDILSLTNGIFEHLRPLEIITTEDLKKKLGISGLRWPMKVLARTLRQLEALGCVKQVRAQANTDIATALYFRCVKLIREPDETEWQMFLSPHRGQANQTIVTEDGDLDADYESDDEYGLAESLGRLEENGAQFTNLADSGRPVAQWDGHRCLNNFLFDLINKAGTRGMSTMDIKRYAFGGLNKKPLDYQIGRLTCQWQVSQPPHLRHLAIVKDTAMNKTISYYVHYSYKNFKALVDSGKASWEAVNAVSESKKKGKNPAATVHNKLGVDEYGFPRLQTTLFQGQRNNATPSECALAAKPKPISLTGLDLTPKQLSDGNYTLQHESKLRTTYPQRAPDAPKQPREHKPSNLSFKPRGRPRKLPRSGIPANIGSMAPKEIQKLLHAQQAAVKYDVQKIEKEIDRRVEAGAEYTETVNEVLREVEREHTKLGLPPSLAVKAVHIRSSTLEGRVNNPIVPAGVIAEIPGTVGISPFKAPRKSRPPQGKKTTCSAEYQPSIVAHSQLTLPPPLAAIKTPKESTIKTASITSRKRFPSICLAYMPSIAAHSQPNLLHSSVTKPHDSMLPPETAGPQSPQNAAQGGVYERHPVLKDTFVDQSPPSALRLKRKRSEVGLSGSEKRITRLYQPSITAQDQDVHVRQQTATQDFVARELLVSIRTESELKNYRKQLNDIKRPTSGVFIGRRTTVYRKGGSGPRKSQFAIFKSHRLNELICFQVEALSPQQKPQITRDRTPEARSSTDALPDSALEPIESHQSIGGRLDMPAGPTDVRDSLVPEVVVLRNTEESNEVSHFPSVSLNDSLGQLEGTTSVAPNLPTEPQPSNLMQDHSQNRLLETVEGSPNTTAESSHENSHSLHTSQPPETGPSTAPFVDSIRQDGSELPKASQIAHSTSERCLPADNQIFACKGGTRDRFLNDSEKIMASPETRLKAGKQGQSKVIANKMTLTGGSVGFLRRRIILEIIEKCGGVFPSDRELVYPFIYAWQKEGKPGSPERATVTAACKSLYASGKLRQLYFSFKAKNGVMVTKPMMTLQEVSPTDPKVKEVQRKIIDAYPRYYIPDEAEIPEDVRTRVSAPIAYGNNRTFPYLEIDHEARVELQHKPLYVRRIESPETPRSKVPKHMTTSEIGMSAQSPKSKTDSLNSSDVSTKSKEANSPRIIASSGNNYGFVRRPDLDPNQNLPTRKVQRLASIIKPKTAAENPVTSYDISSLSESLQRLQSYPPLSAVDAAYDFTKLAPNPKTHFGDGSRSLADIADPSPGVVEPQFDPPESSLFRGDSSGAWQRETYLPNAFASETHSLQSGVPDLFEENVTPSNGFPQGKSQTRLKKASKPYFPSTAAHTQPLLRPTRRTRMKRYLPSIAAHTQPICKPITLKRRYVPQLQRPWSRRKLEPNWPKVKSLPRPQPKPMKRPSRSLASLSTTVSSVKASYALRTLDGLSIDPWYAHNQDSTIMNPEHIFHKASGTYSTVFRQVDTMLEATKPDQVYSDWGLSEKPSVEWKNPEQNPNATEFEAEVDKLLKWELATQNFKHATRTDYPLINHIFRHPHEVSTIPIINMNDAVHVFFSKLDSRLLYRKFAPSIVSRVAPIVKAAEKIAPKTRKVLAPVSSDPVKKVAKQHKRKREPEPKEYLMSRRLTALPDGQSRARPRRSGGTLGAKEADGRPIKLRRIRGPQSKENLGKQGEERLIFATLVIRTLTGGVERHIDWVLVARLFEPQFDQMFVQNRWNSVLNKYRFEYERLYSQFQDLFTQAYEDGTVPPIDYDDLENYDWAWLVDWTMENIEAPSKETPSLLADRPKFDEQFDLRETHENDLQIFYETEVVHSVPLRTTNILKQTYVCPLEDERHAPTDQVSAQFAVAKNWIRANIVTPEERYNSELAKERLLKFDEATIELALKDLMASRILSQQNKGRLVPGRNYYISQYSMDRLKKNLEVEQFIGAAAYKRQIDKDLEENGTVDFSPLAGDGVVIGLMNMQAQGRIEIRPKDPPMNKFGLIDGGYETRKMDKSRLNFTCEIRPNDTYVLGNPLLPLPPPPSQYLGIPMSKIPFWYDIHDALIPSLWNMVVAAILSLLSLRPGITAKELEKNMRPILETWEIEQVLEWMVDAKAATKKRNNYTVTEWWWLCIDVGKWEEDVGVEVRETTGMIVDED